MRTVNYNFGWKGTTNTNTLKAWKDAGVEIEEKPIKNAKTGETKTTYYRPDIEIEVELPEVDELLEDDRGRQLLDKLVERTTYQFLQPIMDRNQAIESSPSADDLLKFVTEPVKQSALKANKEEMEQAAAVFKQFLHEIGKEGQAADLQVTLFQNKFSSSRMEKFAQEYIMRGATKEKVLTIVDAIIGNVQRFKSALEKDDNAEARDACWTPALICEQNLEGWKDGYKEAEPEEMLEVEQF